MKIFALTVICYALDVLPKGMQSFSVAVYGLSHAHNCNLHVLFILNILINNHQLI